MPPVLGSASFDIKEYGDASAAFHLIYGTTFAKWGLIEQRLFEWFWLITGMQRGMARAVFYSGRNFTSRADMISAALAASPIAQPEADFLKAAIKKARQFSAFRNTLAHGEPTFNALPDSPTFKQFIYIQGNETPYVAAQTGVTVRHLEVASQRFSELAKLLMDMTEYIGSEIDPTKPAEYLRQVQALPNEPWRDAPDPKPAKRSRPPRPSRA